MMGIMVVRHLTSLVRYVHEKSWSHREVCDWQGIILEILLKLRQSNAGR